jgi:hypothetical protein
MSGTVTLFPIPQSAVVPAVGQCFNLLSGQMGEAIALDDGRGQLVKTANSGGGSKFFYVKDANTFSDAMSFSMKAGGGGWGASYGMTADASALVQTSALTQSIHFRGVAHTTQSVVSPKAALSADAAQKLAQGMDAFTQTYGTHFVAGYIYGKNCNLSFNLNFSTLAVATTFSSSFSESETAAGFGENMQASISNTMKTTNSSCSFTVESNYRGFASVSPQSMTDLAKVVADYDAAAGDTTAVLLIIYPWTYLDQVTAASLGLPMNDAVQELAALTNKLLYIKQSGQTFIDGGRFAGASQLKAITRTGQSVQKELDGILGYLQSCNADATAVTQAGVDRFPAAEPLADQMNTALRRFCLAFSVATPDWGIAPEWAQLAAAEELAPQSNALQLLDNGHHLSTVYNDHTKGVWFDISGSHNLCAVPSAGLVMGFTSDPDKHDLVGWCYLGPEAGQVSPPLDIGGRTNARSLDDPDNTAKLYWPISEPGANLQITLCPV